MMTSGERRLLVTVIAVAVLLALPLLAIRAYDLTVSLTHRRWTKVTGVVERAEEVNETDTGGLTYGNATHVLVALSVPNHGRVYARSGGTRHGWTDSSIDWWMRKHPSGTPVEIRLDPKDPQSAELVDLDGLPRLSYSKLNIGEIYVFALAFVGFGWWTSRRATRA